jgi:hypothetical protein
MASCEDLVEHVPQDERPQWKHNIGTCIAELPRPITKRPHRVNQAEIQNLVKFAKRSGVDEEQTLEILAFPSTSVSSPICKKSLELGIFGLARPGGCSLRCWWRKGS